MQRREGLLLRLRQALRISAQEHHALVQQVAEQIAAHAPQHAVHPAKLRRL